MEWFWDGVRHSPGKGVIGLCTAWQRDMGLLGSWSHCFRIFMAKTCNGFLGKRAWQKGMCMSGIRNWSCSFVVLGFRICLIQASPK